MQKNSFDIGVTDHNFLNQDRKTSMITNDENFFRIITGNAIPLPKFDLVSQSKQEELFIPGLYDFTFLLTIFNSIDELNFEKTNFSDYNFNPKNYDDVINFKEPEIQFIKPGTKSLIKYNTVELNG